MSERIELPQVTDEMVKLAKEAMAKVTGYSVRLTRMVDGEEVYTASLPGEDPIDFGYHEDAVVYAQERMEERRARAALEAAVSVALPTDAADIRPQVNVEAWRPMESAPRDGTHILAIVINPGDNDAGTPDTQEIREVWFSSRPGFLGGTTPWLAGGYGHSGQLGAERYGEGLVKGWMPLPAAAPAPPPQTSGSGPDEIALAIDMLEAHVADRAVLMQYGGEAARQSEPVYRDAARAHLDAVILAHVAERDALAAERNVLASLLNRSNRIADARKVERAAVIPPQWKLVPVEPTPEMLKARWHQTGESREMRARVDHQTRREWEAQLAASPTPPAITLADIVALLTSEKVVEKMIDEFYGDNTWRSSGHAAAMAESLQDMRAALRVATEAVLKMGANK